MEMHGLKVADVVVDDARALHETLIGSGAYRYRGFETLSRRVFAGKPGNFAHCAGMMQAVIDEALKYAKERTRRGEIDAPHRVNSRGSQARYRSIPKRQDI